MALVGPNGAGKSTLFSLILKTDTPDSGEVIRDEWTTVGFLPQESEPVGNESVLDVATGKAGEIEALEKILRDFEATGDVSSPEYFEAHAKHDALQDPQTEAKAKRILKGLGYKEEDFARPAREFSGGWVMRAHMTRLLVMEPDLLLLDEPTNHLDLLSLMWFRNYLKNYPGALLIISHDRDFMDELVQSVYEIEESKLIAYQGNYSDYLKQREENWERAMQAYDASRHRLIVGLVDDDANLRSRRVGGFVVLGGGTDLPALITKYRIDELIITGPMSEDAHRVLMDICQDHHLQLSQWHREERVLHAVETGPKAASEAARFTSPATSP